MTRLPCIYLLAIACITHVFTVGCNQQQPEQADSDRGTVRFATYNASLYRDSTGALIEELESGKSTHASQIAEVIQIARPDVLLVNEFDFDEEQKSATAFREKYLAVSQNGNDPIEYPYAYSAPVNTGIDTGIDLDGNGETGKPTDAFGYGTHPGQYGMLILSRYELDTDNIRTFQNFLWKDMPDAKLPIVPDSGDPYYQQEAIDIFRLSSKSHWDVPVKVSDDKTIHFLVSHPTPPVFDQDEDRNGCRNHDEIRLFADYINGADYLYDDNGNKGGLAAGSHFIIAGDQNADPNDGDSRDNAARLFTDHPLVCTDPVPASAGGTASSEEKGGRNSSHTGDPSFDTGDWNHGNLRVDYCLPSKTLTVTECGVFWPVEDQPGADAIKATDHRMVWIDVEK